MSPKGPPFIFLIFCNRTNIKKSQRVPFRFFGTVRLLNILIFSKIFPSLQRVLLQFFLKFCKRMHVKKSQRSPFIVSGIVRFFKMNSFCLKIWFPQAQHAISDFCLFSKTGVFYATFFLICFHRSPPHFTGNETFCEHEGLLKAFVHYATYRRPSSKKSVNQFSVFFFEFSVEKDGFSAVSSWGRMVLETYAYPFGYFLTL